MFNLLINLSKMKKKCNLLQLIVCAMIMVVAVVGSCSISSCGKMPWSKKAPSMEETIDSLVNAKVKKTVNPTFYSVDEVTVYQELTRDGNKIDSVFNAMPYDILKNVSHVLIKKNGTTTKKEIVTEFTSHKDIYPNLPKTPDSITEDSVVNAKGKKSGVFSTSYKYRTDTVDGIPVKVQIKEEESYVEE